MENNYKYVGYFFILLIPLTFIGFYKSYFESFPIFNENISFWHHLHAVIASLWILMLIIQPLLIHYKKFHLHKSLGKISYALFSLLILSFVPMTISLVNRFNISYIFFPLANVVLLLIFYSLAIFYKRKKEFHMRYMIATALVFIDPTVSRIVGHIFPESDLMWSHVVFGINYSILFGLIIMDRLNRRNFIPYGIALTCFIIYQASYYIMYLYVGLVVN